MWPLSILDEGWRGQDEERNSVDTKRSWSGRRERDYRQERVQGLTLGRSAGLVLDQEQEEGGGSADDREDEIEHPSTDIREGCKETSGCQDSRGEGM